MRFNAGYDMQLQPPRTLYEKIFGPTASAWSRTNTQLTQEHQIRRPSAPPARRRS